MDESAFMTSRLRVIKTVLVGFMVPLYLVAQPIDKHADDQTTALFNNLRKLAGQKLMLGHQDGLAYGVLWKKGKNRSDIKDVCGDYPAVLGWDLGYLSKKRTYNIDTVSFKSMRKWMQFIYERGGVNTLSWHMHNLGSGGDSWDITPAVKDILPGGKNHHLLVEQLDLFAWYLGKIKVDGRPIPIIFRPWHENNGGWFWWGSKSCTPEEYIRLWQFTVTYLRDIRGLHNLLYCYSPSEFNTLEEMLVRYPGDDYVDILGIDFYYRGTDMAVNRRSLLNRINLQAQYALPRGKIATLSEVGYETIPLKDWWTGTFLENVLSAFPAGQLSYALFWRNARTNHHYAPFPGHTSADDFVDFIENDYILTLKDLPRLYSSQTNTDLKK